MSGVTWIWLRIRQALFHHENLEVRAIALWTRMALDTSGGGGGGASGLHR